MLLVGAHNAHIHHKVQLSLHLQLLHLQLLIFQGDSQFTPAKVHTCQGSHLQLLLFQGDSQFTEAQLPVVLHPPPAVLSAATSAS